MKENEKENERERIVTCTLGKNGWQLACMTPLSHGTEPFTGIYELAFKRPS